jgi:hypothetical protein
MAKPNSLDESLELDKVIYKVGFVFDLFPPGFVENIFSAFEGITERQFNLVRVESLANSLGPFKEDKRAKIFSNNALILPFLPDKEEDAFSLAEKTLKAGYDRAIFLYGTINDKDRLNESIRHISPAHAANSKDLIRPINDYLYPEGKKY